jgi:hypothetical protein
MTTYTLFGLLHQRSNRMDQLARYEASDDSTAMELAGRLSRNRTTELWSEHRQVGKFDGPPRADADPEEGRAA